MAGRRPKPSALKELAGNPGHRPLNADEVKPPVAAPEKPKNMSRAASREWDRMVPKLIALHLLTDIDGKALMAYCECYATWEMAVKEKRRIGLIVEEPVLSKDGAVVGTKYKANPAVSIELNAAKTMKAFLIEFGLTPASRSKLHIEKPKEVDPFEAAMGRRNMTPIEPSKHDAPQPVAFDTGKISDASVSFDA